MNGLIKELARQASLPITCEYEIPDEFVENFAELLVRDCLNVINQPNGVGDDDVIRISDDVKKHFGVEE